MTAAITLVCLSALRKNGRQTRPGSKNYIQRGIRRKGKEI